MTDFEQQLIEQLKAVNTNLAALIVRGQGFQNLSFTVPAVGVKKSRYSLFAWLDEWFHTYKAPNLKDGGYDMGNTIKKHIKPHADNKLLCEVSGVDITKALNKIKSERMRQVTRAIYKQVFDKAVEVCEIEKDKNPMLSVDTVKHDYENGRTLERAEERLFIYHAKKDTEMFPLFRFYLLSGARPSEPLAMTWDDCIKDDTFRINGTKTKTSDRWLPMFPEIKKLFESIPRTGKYIFPFRYATVRKHFNAIRGRLDNQDITLKDLRHTFGTRCLESGVSIKTVSKWLGHSNTETTERIYLHITNDFEKEEIARFSGQIIRLKRDLI